MDSKEEDLYYIAVKTNRSNDSPIKLTLFSFCKQCMSYSSGRDGWVSCMQTVCGCYELVWWRVLKSLATYVMIDIYVAKDWACAIDPMRRPASHHSLYLDPSQPPAAINCCTRIRTACEILR